MEQFAHFYDSFTFFAISNHIVIYLGKIENSLSHAVKWGESGLAGRVGTKCRTLKTENRLQGRVFGGAEGVFDASPECFRKSKSLLMQMSLCF